jgi:dipeptidyl aminopeptidase/acylaminoacyl peptidase
VREPSKPIRLSVLVALLVGAAMPAIAAVPTPKRPVTDPKSLASPEKPDAAPVPIGDLGFTRGFGDAAWSADGKQVFVVTNLTGRYNIWRTDADGSWPVQLVQSEDGQQDLAPSPDGKTLLYAQDKGGNEYYDIYAVPAAGGQVRQITRTPDVTESRPMWSPDGKQVAVLVRPKSSTNQNVALLDPETGAVRALTAEASPEYNWQLVRWSPDGRSIIANRMNIMSTRASAWRIDVASGKAEQLTPKAEDLTFATDISADGQTIGLTSNAGTGQLHAGLLDVATGKIRWLKPTPWEQNSGSMSPDGKTMIVSTGIDGRTILSLVDVTSAAERALAFPPGLDFEPAMATRSFAPDSRRLLIYHAAADTAGEIYVADSASGDNRRLTRFAMASLDPARLPKSQIVTYRSFDQTPVSAIVTMPFNLKRDGSNPAVVIPHGGPTGQAVDSFSKTAAALASRGYVVIQPNFRGSTGYGKAFQEANIKDLGGGDLKDVLAAKDFLVASGYVDPKKVGITGGSYGGFMTLMALGKAPDAFAAGVQLFGIINWKTMWTAGDASLREYQRDLVGDPDKDPALYKAQSPMTYLAAAKAPLLSLQGENDIRVPRGQAQEVADLLKAKNVPTETVFYPAEGHGFMKRENQADSLQRTVDWFDTYLKGGK